MKTLEFSLSLDKTGCPLDKSNCPGVVQELLPLELRTTLANSPVIVDLGPGRGSEPLHPGLVVNPAGLLGLLLLALDGPDDLLCLLRGVVLVADREGVNDPWHPEEQAQKHVEECAKRLPAEQDGEGRTNDAEECSHI